MIEIFAFGFISNIRYNFNEINRSKVPYLIQNILYISCLCNFEKYFIAKKQTVLKLNYEIRVFVRL